jgi:transcription elongation GreA/GreB family factor
MKEERWEAVKNAAADGRINELQAMYRAVSILEVSERSGNRVHVVRICLSRRFH